MVNEALSPQDIEATRRALIRGLAGSSIIRSCSEPKGRLRQSAWFTFAGSADMALQTVDAVRAIPDAVLIFLASLWDDPRFIAEPARTDVPADRRNTYPPAFMLRRSSWAALSRSIIFRTFGYVDPEHWTEAASEFEILCSIPNASEESCKRRAPNWWPKVAERIWCDLGPIDVEDLYARVERECARAFAAVGRPIVDGEAHSLRIGRADVDNRLSYQVDVAARTLSLDGNSIRWNRPILLRLLAAFQTKDRLSVEDAIEVVGSEVREGTVRSYASKLNNELCELLPEFPYEFSYRDGFLIRQIVNK